MINVDVLIPRYAALVGLAMAVLVLAGCRQSPEDQVYEAFKCGKAAALLEHDDEARRAMDAIEPLATKIIDGGSMARYAMELGQRFQDEVPLYRLSAGDQLRMLQKIYESDDCQAMYSPRLLELGNASVGPQPQQAGTPVAASSSEPHEGQPISGQAEATAAIMNVAKLLATEHGGDPMAVAQFCDQNARELVGEEQLQQCKALGGPTALVPVPKTAEEAFRTAATLPVKARFDYCTSEPARKLFIYKDDYERCFPSEAQAEAERMGGVNDQNQSPVQVSPEAIKEQIIANSAKMSPRERKAYCYIPSVLAEFESDPSQCLNGMLIPTDDDPGYRDEGH